MLFKPADVFLLWLEILARPDTTKHVTNIDIFLKAHTSCRKAIQLVLLHKTPVCFWKGGVKSIPAVGINV